MIHMLRFFLTVLCVGAFVGSLVWYRYEPDFEPAISAAVAFAVVIALFVNEKRRERKTELQLQREEKGCRGTYERIQRERRNFEKLAETREIKYSGEYHRRAVEEYPWQLLREEALKLRDTRLFPILSRRLIKYIDERNPKQVLRLMNKLEPKLKQHFVE